MEQGEQGEMTVPVTLTAVAASNKPADELAALAAQLGCSIRVCLDAGQISEDQAREILRRIPQY
jgi:hypothetical protein